MAQARHALWRLYLEYTKWLQFNSIPETDLTKAYCIIIFSFKIIKSKPDSVDFEPYGYHLEPLDIISLYGGIFLVWKGYYKKVYGIPYVNFVKLHNLYILLEKTFTL